VRLPELKLSVQTKTGQPLTLRHSRVREFPGLDSRPRLVKTHGRAEVVQHALSSPMIPESHMPAARPVRDCCPHIRDIGLCQGATNVPSGNLRVPSSNLPISTGAPPSNLSPVALLHCHSYFYSALCQRRDAVISRLPLMMHLHELGQPAEHHPAYSVLPLSVATRPNSCPHSPLIDVQLNSAEQAQGGLAR
jgi:hypothetical protein